MLALLCCVVFVGVVGVCDGASMPPSANTTTVPTILLNDTSRMHLGSRAEISSRNAQMMPGFYNLDDFVHAKFVANKIVGGSEATKGEFPYQAALLLVRDDTVHQFCGGALISRTLVVTAAHCVEWLTDFSAVQIVLGDHQLRDDEGTEQRLNVRTVVVHEQYDKWALINDIALILLEGVAEFNDFVRPVNLPRKMDVESAGNATISGWGSTIQGGAGSRLLMKAMVPVVTDAKCAKAYKPFEEIMIDPTHICAGVDKGGIDSCQGDSGGPMVCDERVLKPEDEEKWFITTGDQHERPSSSSVKTGPYLCGVVSFGVGCGEPGIPGVYTQVSHYLDWIEEVVRNLTALPDDDMDGSRKDPLMMGQHYPFLGMVSNQPIDLLSRKHPVACIGILLADNLVLTAADCVAPYADDEESSFWVGFGSNITPGSKTFQRIPVSDWFGFDPMMYLEEVADHDIMEQAEQRHHDSAYRNKALVLELAWNVVYTNEIYPVNFARKQDFVGMKAQLVSLTHKKRDKYFFRLKMKPVVSDFDIVPLDMCPESYLMEYNLNATDAICAKRMSADQRPCSEFPPGSALICNTYMHMEDSRMEDDDMDMPSSFLCGIIAHMHEDNSTSPMEQSMSRNDSDYCMFRKIWVSELADKPFEMMSNFTLAAVGKPFFEADSTEEMI